MRAGVAKAGLMPIRQNSAAENQFEKPFSDTSVSSRRPLRVYELAPREARRRRRLAKTDVKYAGPRSALGH